MGKANAGRAHPSPGRSIELGRGKFLKLRLLRLESALKDDERLAKEVKAEEKLASAEAAEAAEATAKEGTLESAEPPPKPQMHACRGKQLCSSFPSSFFYVHVHEEGACKHLRGLKITFLNEKDEATSKKSNSKAYGIDTFAGSKTSSCLHLPMHLAWLADPRLSMLSLRRSLWDSKLS